jgi:hypothetical protein
VPLAAEPASYVRAERAAKREEQSKMEKKMTMLEGDGEIKDRAEETRNTAVGMGFARKQIKKTGTRKGNSTVE